MGKKADYTVMKGDSSPLVKIKVSNYPVLDADWSCNQYLVLASDPNTQIAAKSLNRNPTNEYFEAFLTAGETDLLLEEQEYIWVWQVLNPNFSPMPFSQRITSILKIKKKFG